MARRKRPPGKRRLSASQSRLLGIGLVLFLLGLDLAGWLTGRTSFVFRPLFGSRAVSDETELIFRVIEDELAAHGIKSSSLKRYRDDRGGLHVKISLAPGEYERLEDTLKRRFFRENLEFVRDEKESDLEGTYHFWEVRSPKGRPIRILFSRPSGRTPVREEVERPQVSLILDDVGYNLEILKDACELPIPLTVAILPFSPQALASAQIAHESGREIMLHLPLESRDHHQTEKHTQGLLTVGMTDDEIRSKTKEAVYRIPYLRGVNNHMGSLFTEDGHKMEPLLSVLRETGLYFIDSRTSGRSRGLDAARKLGVPAAACDLFLDEPGDRSALERNCRELARIAGKRGWALGIIHPYPETIEALTRCAALFRERGVELVYASTVVERAQKK